MQSYFGRGAKWYPKTDILLPPSRAWVAPEGRQRGSCCPRALAPLLGVPQGKILMVMKCPLVHMPRCDLSNNLQLLLHIPMKCFGFRGAFPSCPSPHPTTGSAAGTCYIFDAHNNWIRSHIWLTHKKFIALLCPDPCPLLLFPSFRFLVPPMLPRWTSLTYDVQGASKK